MTKKQPSFRLKKIGILTLATLLISCSFVKQDPNCDQFKKGKFVFYYYNSNGQIDRQFSITRNDSMQVEIDKASGKYSKLSIKWTSQCSYDLKLLESNFEFPDSIQKMRKSVTLKNTILSSTNDYYIFQSKSDNSTNNVIDTLWIDK